MTSETRIDASQDMSVEDRTLDGPHGPLRVRVYEPSKRNARGIGFVWAHGGTWSFGDLDFPEAHGVSLALAAAGITVVSVDYQLAAVPEPYVAAGLPARDGVFFPIASEEVTAVFQWASTESGLPVRAWSLGGGSAGGNLAAGACLRLRDRGEPMPRTLVLAYAALHATLPAPSDELAKKATAAPSRFLPPDLDFKELYRSLVLNYVGNEEQLESPYAFPGGHDLRGLPPVFVLNSDSDFLRTSGEQFAAELASAGVDVLQIRENGTVHGHLMEPERDDSVRSFRRIVAWLSSEDLVGTAHETA
ncbi:acetyl esterase/lipase [Kibdelosporangium banguiense]|uniref:Acetyl esterase/lipase n=1 Tax=Kibdelosporangium banguiense TaxID=1365924 RepID=A0ABS4TYD1_9PSEU|nr:alpha/beta hydrolase fold domain-containing protein [Kibdelosporangium banguiense]MBP2328989.1 acetyl esterase/lipase [Kibdelosporangium banguiense]